jgi:hypothetical protein
MRAILPMGLGDDGAGRVVVGVATVGATGTIAGLLGFVATQAASAAAVTTGRALCIRGLTATLGPPRTARSMLPGRACPSD